MNRKSRRMEEGYFQGASGRRSQLDFDGADYGRVGGSYQSFGDDARWKNEVRAEHYNNDHFGYGNRERTWNKNIDVRDAVTGHFGKGPKGYKRSNQRIFEEACEALTLSPDVDASEIEINVEDGLVTLSGTVESKRMKREAEWIIDGIPGVLDVLNFLRTRGEPRPEENIERKVSLDKELPQSM